MVVCDAAIECLVALVCVQHISFIYLPKGRKLWEKEEFMSSHHFVKEGQEPALLIIDALADDHLMAILEWSPMVLVVASAMPTVASWGIRVDAVFVDQHAHNDSVAYESAPHIGAAILIDSNELVSSVLCFLRQHLQYALQVMTTPDEEDFRTWESTGDFPVTLFDTSTKWSRISAGQFEKWMPEGAELCVRTDAGFDVSGAISNKTNQVKTARAGLVRISSAAPFWIGEHLR